MAHGIASDLNGERALIGSAHFIFDDEKISISDEQRALVENLSEKYSLVYLAVGGALCGILCIEDPIRKNAAAVIDKLKKLGMNDIIMITGDGESTAANVCRELGIEKHYAKVLPEDKLNIVNDIKSKNHKVIMVGDGINDSPALAAADVSVAMKDASDIAREVADITLLSSKPRPPCNPAQTERKFIRQNTFELSLYKHVQQCSYPVGSRRNDNACGERAFTQRFDNGYMPAQYASAFIR